MAVPMPAIAVLIVCKVMSAGPSDQNADKTGAENLQWDTSKYSMMICRRHEIQLYDPAVDQGAAPLQFTPMSCQRNSPRLWAQWNIEHKNTNWRVWRAACPVPTINTITGEIIAWTLPPCGHADTVICEVDSQI